MKMIHRFAVGAVVAWSAVASFAYSYDPMETDIRKILRASSGPIIPGEWNTNLEAGKAYAQANHMPLLFIWGNTGCGFCRNLGRACTDDRFDVYIRQQQIVMIVNEGDMTTKSFAKFTPKTLSAFPFVKVWWPRAVGGTVEKNWEGRSSLMLYESYDGDTVNQMIESVKMCLVGWEPTPPVSLGEFADPDTDFNRLEIEDATTSVPMRLVRDERKAQQGTNVTLVVVTPGAKTVFSQKIVWAAKTGTNQVVNVTPASGWSTGLKSGDKLTAYLQDPVKKTYVATNHITYVKGNSASNPDFTGCAGYGQWTMAFEAATNHVAAKGGYTLVAVQGSQWCPDCANTERNFLDLEDEHGANRFKAWAASHNVALVAMDIPNFTGPNATDYNSATLLSRTAYEAALARAKEYPQSGADEALTKKAPRSGLGYLTRKCVSDKVAGERLRKNQILATTDTDKGGFHRPEDTNKNRTGVPIFVLLRRDGSLAGRLTRFASVSPMKADQANFAAYVKRLEEMMENAADKTEIGNDDARTTKVALDAFSGKAEATVSHADAKDTYKLTGVSNGALVGVTVTGKDGSGPVELELQWRASETSATVEKISLVTGDLSDGAAFLATLDKEDGGAYYVQVRSVFTNAPFQVENAASTVRSYEIASRAVLTPVQSEAKRENPGTAEMAIVVVAGTVYRLVGFKDPTAGGAFEKVEGADGNLYRALETAQVPLVAEKPDQAVAYQQWVPGTVGFVDIDFKKPVKESAGRVVIPFQRTGGVSGDVTVTVIHDKEHRDSEGNIASILTDSDGNKRYEEMDPVTVTWKDGVQGVTNICFTLKDDQRHDGYGLFFFKLTKDSGYSEVVNETFRLLVEEDDTQDAGRVAFTAAEPAFSKPLTVYAKTSQGVTLFAERLGASDGPVSVTVTTTAGLLDVAKIEWANHQYEAKPVKLTGLSSGQVAYVSFGNPAGGLGIDVDARTVRVVAVPDEGPEFESADQGTKRLYKNVSYEEDTSIVVKVDPSSLHGGEVSFVKTMGTLPAGLSVGADADGNMEISGVPTKAGTYEAVYQAYETVEGVSVPGLTTRLVFEIVDVVVAAKVEGGAPINATIAETRNYTDIPVIDKATKRLAGLLQLTLPATGKVSAKYTCAKGTVALASACWTVPPDTDNTMSTLLEATRSEYSAFVAGVYAFTNGAVRVTIVDPDYEDALEAVADRAWANGRTAAPWAGYYTVALPVTNVLTDADGVAPHGSGYLNVQINGEAAFASGRAKWAGMLPNGTAVSGSAVLTTGTDASGEWAYLPFFVSSARDRFCGVARILKDAQTIKAKTRRTVFTHPDCTTFWSHRELPVDESYAYAVELGLYGAIYDPANDSLGGCCQESYETTDMFFRADETGLSPLPVTVTDDNIVIKGGASNPNNVSLRLTRATGLAEGTFKMMNGAAPVIARWKGVVLTGWGEGCKCEDVEGPEQDVFLPLVNGFWTFSDRRTYEATAFGQPIERTVYLKIGGRTSVDK